MSRRIISLWLPYWHTDLWRRRNQDQPAESGLALHTHDGRRHVVAAADRVARAAGIVPGMALTHARALVPDLSAPLLDADADGDALERLAEWCLWLSPLVAIDAPDGIWIDSTGCDHLQGGEAPMLNTLAGRLASLGLTCRLALAETPGAAHALARYGRNDRIILSAGGQGAALAALPVGGLRLAGQTEEGLQRLGLRTIGALQAAPRAPLTRRFGADVMRRLDQAMGTVFEPIQPLRPRDAIAPRRSFVEPIGTAEAIATVIDVLVDDAAQELVRRGMGARLIDLVCDRVDASVQVCRVGLAAPAYEAAHIARLLREQIETIEPGFGIEAMQLVVVRIEPIPADGRMRGLLAAEHGAADLGCLIDRLRNREGIEQIYRLAEAGSHLPERTQVRVALPDASGRKRIPIAWQWSAQRPARLFSPPEPILVLSTLPADPPRLFVWRGGRHRVRAADGPERIHGEWWHDADEYGAVRDYWVVEDDEGGRFWLFRHGDGVHEWSGDLSWFVHGVL
ncbi:DNA polymerase Y family protein [Gluconacetobacter sp. 1b LMG 1731]|uniref:DNA-directed DNA polymerase n=1 Tax=Gluconacetobacter dulcium TaxID=2729096 RepID=A0A7W4IKK8_9PROT|nr:DNA polymerase Y family protein [Gluconacetobacter dulcium]MBB2164613.1 DNA polymerase Y family protein [Gluconacetobacter dulcium]MBB2193620.1 DNA polymerase Y family protein [Gluconacetobacter dulcium]